MYRFVQEYKILFTSIHKLMLDNICLDYRREHYLNEVRNVKRILSFRITHLTKLDT